MSSYTIRLVRWSDARDSLASVREAVFMREQGVPAHLECDGLDETCIHALAEDEYANAIGTGRALPDGHVGRMAVLKEWRNRGVGSGILRALINAAHAAGFGPVQLHAQTHAVPFYERAGFRVMSQEFMEAGIPHVRMILTLGSDQDSRTGMSGTSPMANS